MRVFSKYCQLSFIILLMGCAVAKADMTSRIDLSHTLNVLAKGVIVDVREDSEWNEAHSRASIFPWH